MSETGIGNSPAGKGGVHEQASLSEQMLEPLVQFSKEQPLAMAVCAFVLGYILGKLF